MQQKMFHLTIEIINFLIIAFIMVKRPLPLKDIHFLNSLNIMVIKKKNY